MHLIRSTSACAAWGITAALALLVAPPQARPAGVEDFYKGKTVSLLIGYSVGGGYDATGGWWRDISASTFPAIPTCSRKT
jgi:predicted MFS family arabinose efflux permease